MPYKLKDSRTIVVDKSLSIEFNYTGPASLKKAMRLSDEIVPLWLWAPDLLEACKAAVEQLFGDAAWLESSGQPMVAKGARMIASKIVSIVVEAEPVIEAD